MTLESLTKIRHESSRAVNAENPTGEPGKGGIAASELGPSRKGSPCLRNIPVGATATLADITGPGCIRHIWITVDEKTTDADCFNMYFSMPFGARARITLENQHKNAISAFFYQIDYTVNDEPFDDDIAYFHAQWRRQRLTEKGRDYVVLDGVKGEGHYVGTYLALTTLERYWWGEGEFKFYIDDDEEYPTICGTGTEDYFGGSWSFAKQVNGKTVEQNYCTPYLGYPYYSSHDELIHNDYHNDDCPPMRGFYRWHIPDPIRFRSNLKVTVQQIGVGHRGFFERQDDVASVAYWYQKGPHAPFPQLPSAEERWPR